MLNNQHFYHQHIRRAIIAFGSLFNKIQVVRTNSDGEDAQNLFVPLSYAPKQKFVARIQDAPNVDASRQPFEITLPRIGFEITNFLYDSSRKLSVTQQVRAVDTTGTTPTGTQYSFVSTPYNMGISMSVFAKNQDDGLQIVEQIFPYFNPDFNVTINTIPALGVKNDMQIILDNVNFNDEWEGDFSKRLSVIWDLNFTVKLNFYGYVRDAQLIKTSIQKAFVDNALVSRPMVSGVNATVTGNNVVGTKIKTTYTPATSTPIDEYQYVTEFDTIYTAEE